MADEKATIAAIHSYRTNERIKEATGINALQQRTKARFNIAFEPEKIGKLYLDALTVLDNSTGLIMKQEVTNLDVMIKGLKDLDNTLADHLLTEKMRTEWLIENVIAKINSYKSLISIYYPGASEFLDGRTKETKRESTTTSIRTTTGATTSTTKTEKRKEAGIRSGSPVTTAAPGIETTGEKEQGSRGITTS